MCACVCVRAHECGGCVGAGGATPYKEYHLPALLLGRSAWLSGWGTLALEAQDQKIERNKHDSRQTVPLEEQNSPQLNRGFLGTELLGPGTFLLGLLRGGLFLSEQHKEREGLTLARTVYLVAGMIFFPLPVLNFLHSLHTKRNKKSFLLFCNRTIHAMVAYTYYTS